MKLTGSLRWVEELLSIVGTIIGVIAISILTLVALFRIEIDESSPLRVTFAWSIMIAIFTPLWLPCTTFADLRIPDRVGSLITGGL
jgi:hypothetical protein